VNYLGYIYCTYYALPHLKKSKGQIAIVGSLSGELGLPLRTAYCGSKFAVRGFFEALRNETNEVVITIIAPPSVDTEMRQHSQKQLSSKSKIEFNEDESKKMSVEECAKLIVEAIDSKQRNVVLTLSGKLAVILKPCLPNLIDYFAKKKSGGIVQSKL